MTSDIFSRNAKPNSVNRTRTGKKSEMAFSSSGWFSRRGSQAYFVFDRGGEMSGAQVTASRLFWGSSRTALASDENVRAVPFECQGRASLKDLQQGGRIKIPGILLAVVLAIQWACATAPQQDPGYERSPQDSLAGAIRSIRAGEEVAGLAEAVAAAARIAPEDLDDDLRDAMTHALALSIEVEDSVLRQLGSTLEHALGKPLGPRRN